MESSECSKEESKCPISKLPSLIKFFVTQFLKFYGLRACISLVKYLIFKRGYLKPNLFRILFILLDPANMKTGLFLSLMPFLFELIQNFFNPNKSSKLITFIAGFISGLAGVMVSEKGSFMRFVILSVFVRSLHSLIQVALKERGLPTESRSVTYVVFWLACLGFLYLAYFFPSYQPISSMFITYASPIGNELKELNAIREQLKII
jgi:hypothetical protein